MVRDVPGSLASDHSTSLSSSRPSSLSTAAGDGTLGLQHIDWPDTPEAQRGRLQLDPSHPPYFRPNSHLYAHALGSLLHFYVQQELGASSLSPEFTQTG